MWQIGFHKWVYEKNLPFLKFKYRKVASSNTSRFEAHALLFRLYMKGNFDAYVLWPFGKKFFFELVTRFRTRDSTVFKFRILIWLILNSPSMKTPQQKKYIWMFERSWNSICNLCRPQPSLTLPIWHFAHYLWVVHNSFFYSFIFLPNWFSNKGLLWQDCRTCDILGWNPL